MDRFLVRQSIRHASSSPSVSEREDAHVLEKPAAKRLKRDAASCSDSESTTRISDEDGGEPSDAGYGLGRLKEEEHHVGESFSLTPIEGSVAVEAGEESIREYETMRASQQSGPPQDDDGDHGRSWVRGKSSIYVDAFNLALGTVLDEESHLFNEKERAIFEEWNSLNYESQYLYVRLFLRKTSCWHRIERLGYHSDVSDVDGAVKSLQQSRTLPDTSGDSRPAADSGHVDDLEYGSSLTFADDSDELLTDLEEAASLLSLDELKVLAKDIRAQGRNKAELVQSVCRIGQQQAGLFSLGIRRSRDTDAPCRVDEPKQSDSLPAKTRREDSNRTHHFLAKILATTGPCVRLTPLVFQLFVRVHLVFYRSTEWTDKSLTTIILAKIARRNFPDYVVCRTANIFGSREDLLEYEKAIRVEGETDRILEFGDPPGQKGFERVVEIFKGVYPRWRKLLEQEELKESREYDAGEGAYLRRFSAAHAYTRVIHKAAYVFGRLKDYTHEYSLLCELLRQRLFHLSRRGSWYQRKALLEEHYMFDLDPEPISGDSEIQKKHWRRRAAGTCEDGLRDNDCHLIYHHDLQKRLTKLEKRLRIPRRLQHTFGHVQLREPLEHRVEGIQIKREVGSKPGRAASTKTIWLDELGSGEECSVEDMCLSWYRSQGWKGYHSEGGIIRTIFAYLFFDILFLHVPNVFQTAFQTCPLDLHTDSFYASRASEINHRLVSIANGEAEPILRDVHAREQHRRTSVVGLNWDFDVEDLAELVGCCDGSALAAVCKVMAQEYKQRGGGFPDLVLWRTEPEKECIFSEVKSANDRLSDTQRLWIHVLTGAGVKVALCNAVAREVREAEAEAD